MEDVDVRWREIAGWKCTWQG
eukprot:COSAG02_NODE_61986_length_267_cov_0.613095_1_plen_20_part_01